MDGHPLGSQGPGLATLCALPLVLVLALAAPRPAAAEVTEETLRVGPIRVAGYQVKQAVADSVPEPSADGHIVAMRADLVDADGNQIPIRRLMLHHIVFVNALRSDSTCDAIVPFDAGLAPQPLLARERFYAAGEERARMVLPDGYGYPIDKLGGVPYWAILYMVMNHRARADEAYIEYTVKIDDDPQIRSVRPYWLDVANCQADPIYNVPGGRPAGSTHVESAEFELPAGRVVAGGGHVHGGARMLTLTQPGCGNRELARSTPTWGLPDHPFYNVRPILHEPGPVDMSAFRTETGIPVGGTVRLNSLYEASLPHTRVMGIMIAYLDPDPAVTDPCAALPGDVETLSTDYPGRTAPVPFRVPLTGLRNGKAVTIKKPPGKLRRVRSGATVSVRDNSFSRPNVALRRGARLRWRFDGPSLHNVTLANGPEAVGSPNYGQGGKVFEHRFRRRGTYRLFCGLHPTQMAERIVVGKRKTRR